MDGGGGWCLPGFTCGVLTRKATEDRYYSPPPRPHPNPHSSTIAIAALSYPFTAHKCLQYITVACQHVDETIPIVVGNYTGLQVKINF